MAELSKAARRIRCQQILARGRHRLSDDDQNFLLTYVFPMHEAWAEKRGVGVSHVEVRKHGTFNSVGFWIVRCDGSEIDISYRVCFEGKGTARAKFLSAARSEVQGQVYEWKKQNRAPFDGMHCDHVYPFDSLVHDWLKLVDLTEEEVPTTSQLVGHVDIFLDRSIALSWQRYHAKNAKLQWLTAEDNIRKSNKPDDVSSWVQAFDDALRQSSGGRR